MKNTDKLHWQSSHVPLSVSVCSNVPGYDEAKCFVSNGNPTEFITAFVQYLVSISTKSSFLLRQQYAPVFEALKQEATPDRGESHEGRLAQTLVDIKDGNVASGSSEVESEQDSGEEESEDESRGIDLLDTDDEGDEEEIESENEEDRAFLNEEVRENDPSFYRRLNVELDTERGQEQRQRREEIADCKDLLFGEAQIS